jgi:hypothetical protein
MPDDDFDIYGDDGYDMPTAQEGVRITNSRRLLHTHFLTPPRFLHKSRTSRNLFSRWGTFL